MFTDALYPESFLGMLPCMFSLWFLNNLKLQFKKQVQETINRRNQFLTTFSFLTSSFQLQAQNSMPQSNSLLPPRKVYIKLIMMTILCYINYTKNNTTHQRSDQNTVLYAYNLLTELFMIQTSPRLSLCQASWKSNLCSSLYWVFSHLLASQNSTTAPAGGRLIAC